MALVFIDGCDGYAATADLIKRWSLNTNPTNIIFDATGGTQGGGTPLSAEQSLAVRQLWTASGETLIEAARLAAVAAIANNTLSKTYLSGLANFSEATSDPRRYGESYFQRLASSLVPAGVAEVTRQVDPSMRAAADLGDALKRRLPGASKSLPPRRGLWGRPISYASGLGAVYDTMSPISSSVENPEPIDAEMRRLESFVAMPAKAASFTLAPGGPSVEVNLRNRPGTSTRAASS